MLLYVIHSIIYTSTFTDLKRIFLGSYINPLVIGLLGASMIYPRFTLRKKIGIIFFFLMIVTITGINGFNNKVPIIFSSLFVVALYNKNHKFIFKSLFFAYLISLLTILLLSITGYIDNIQLVRESEIGKVRYSLGFTHPNTFYLYYFACISIFMYINKKNTMLIKSIIIIISFLLYKLTDSRTGFIMVVLMIILETIFSRINLNKGKILKKIIPYLFSIMTLVCYFGTVFLNSNSKIFIFLDSIMSHRLLLMKKFYSLYGISLMGNEVIYKSIENGVVLNPYLILDNTYMYLLIDLGLLFTITLCFLYYVLMKKLIFFNRNREVYLLIIFTIYCVLERLTLLQYNFTILFFSFLFIYKLPKRYKLIIKA